MLLAGRTALAQQLRQPCSPLLSQVEAFLGQLKLAREMNKAVLAHVAGAEAEFTAALARELPPSWPIVLVGYRGSPDWLLK